MYKHNSQPIATYYIKSDSSHSHCIKLYSDGTTLEVLDRIAGSHERERRRHEDGWDKQQGSSDYTFDTHHEEISGTYKNCSYKRQLKDAVIRNHRDGKLKELPTWL
ncbi:hypothetical protein [Rivularia sp. UHCC 0363]|uniref:hypothetical protein n=1 Tax=Rivularia sp. UHCC 0363 TaxID=3110244 RepID=UPI002B21698A|nr:hypothetical protein [Rivularia sp. UHCC 0363]MEA5594982.1 hypothetical protein [Rivularia sp. UHCC 0363]